MIVLDTHIWIWWLSNNQKLSSQQKIVIENAERVGVSAISLFEVSWLSSHDKIDLTCSKQEWFNKALDESNIELIPITPDIASLATELTEHHSDPQDRLIIATALVHNAKLLSLDKKFKLYHELGELGELLI